MENVSENIHFIKVPYKTPEFLDKKNCFIIGEI